MAWNTPGHRFDGDGHYCETDCPQCEKERAAGENKCVYCRTARGSNQHHSKESCFEIVKTIADEERQKRYASYKRGWLHGAARRSDHELFGTPEPESYDDFKSGKEAGEEAFQHAMANFFIKIGGT